MLVRYVAFILSLGMAGLVQGDEIQALFLGDQGHHQPRIRFEQLQTAMAGRGIALTYTEDMGQLAPNKLDRFDTLIVYANIDAIDDEPAKAIVDFVEGGGGLVPLHCASFCFRNQPTLVALIGAQFQSHGTGVFQAEVAEPEHPVTRGFGGFSSWDETYVHRLHNPTDRTVLQYRVTEEGREPWTWVRTQGKGRVFYTASGHDGRTWTNPGFQNLVERGIRWSAGHDPSQAGVYLEESPFQAPAIKPMRTDLLPFSFEDVGPKIPNYTPSRRWGTQGDPISRMQTPLSPDESLKHMVTPEGLDVRLYADERDLQSKPIAMTWDERGRLWVCETLDYPNELGKDRDRIRICEDTDGDGQADQFTVFAERLSIPTAIVIVRGGAIVQNGTETIYLKDTDGDDVADEKTVLINGWAMGDTHGGVSNFRYGLDNWIWAMQGYNQSTPRFDGQAAQSFRQGFWRFRLSDADPPKVTALEFVRSSDNNTWGLGISEEGLIFGSTANRNPSMFLPIPNRYYERVRGWSPSTLHSIADTHQFHPITDAVRQVDQHGGYTAGAGHALYTARAFPSLWWNRTAFVAGPTGHLVGTFVLRPQGANFTSTSPLNLLASDDQWTAPIMAEVGPDGAVWVIDWYNFIVQHNPTPNGFETGKGAAYQSDLRDKKHGRIYRVVPEDTGRLHAFADLTEADNLQLVQTLRHPSMRWRLHAQRLLIQRHASDDAAVIAALKAHIADPSVDETGLNAAAIHALHLLANWSAIDSPTLSKALTHPSAGVRQNALDVSPKTSATCQLLLNHRSLFTRGNFQVRLHAILALADMPTSSSAGAWIDQLAADEADPILIDALTSAGSTHAEGFLKSVATRGYPGSVQTSAQIARRVAEHVARGEPDRSTLDQMIASLTQPYEAIGLAIVDGLIAGLPKNDQREPDDGLDATLRATFRSSHAGVRSRLVLLAQRLGTGALESESKQMADGLLAQMADDTATNQERVAAARDLIALRHRDADVVAEILEETTPQLAPEIAVQWLDAIRASQSDAVGEKITGALAGFSPAIKSVAINVIIEKPTWARALLDAVEASEFDLDQLSLEQKQKLRTLPDEDLRRRAEELLTRGGGLPDADREKVLQSLMHVAQAQGDVEAGLAVFKKNCANCHQHGDIGQKIGPNLTGMAVHPKSELLTHILDPSRNVEGNFRMYNVLTEEGRVISGMLAGESKTSLSIIDVEARRVDLQRSEIEELTALRQSVMPDGFEKQLSERELTDLLEFLTDSGPFIPLPLDQVATAISTKGLFHEGDEGPDRMVFPDWNPKSFQGIPFVLTDPQSKSRPNIILLHGPFGTLPPKMPKSVSLRVGGPVATFHLLGGVGGWSFPYDRNPTVSMIVRIHYSDGSSEDHPLKNGLHIADYIRRVDVPNSQFAFALGDQQLRYLKVTPQRNLAVDHVDFVKGSDNSAPILMAVTVERADVGHARGGEGGRGGEGNELRE